MEREEAEGGEGDGLHTLAIVLLLFAALKLLYLLGLMDNEGEFPEQSSAGFTHRWFTKRRSSGFTHTQRCFT